MAAKAASMTENETQQRAADAAAREFALQELSKPVVLIAGAGTGKTTTLIRRLVVWCVGEGWNRHASAGDALSVAARVLQRITCMTFTEKAAGEMGRKFAEELQRLAADPQHEKCQWLFALKHTAVDATGLRERAEALSAQAHLLRASTIHAFCQRVLREHAVVAKLPPGFSIDAKGARTRAIVGRVFFEELPRLTGASEGAASALWKQSVNPFDVLEALETLVEASASVEDLRAMRFSWDDAHAMLQGMLPDLRTVVQSLPPQKGNYKKLGKAAEVCDVVENICKELAGPAIGKELQRIKKSRVIYGNLATGLTESEADSIGGEAQQRAFQALSKKLKLRFDALESVDPELLAPMRDVLLELLPLVKQRMREEGCLRFDDLLTQTRDLLKDHSSVARQIASEMDQLLLDEVQDTDPCQYSIVRSIIENAVQRFGLFVIGDPKQCIYTFRNADLGALDGFRGFLNKCGSEERELTVNFRSQRPILAEVSALMVPNMKAAPGHQPPFHGLVPHTKAVDVFSAGAAVEYWDVSGIGTARDYARQQRQREAVAIAADILKQRDAEVKAHKTPTKWTEYLILLRSLPDQGLYLNALRRAGIPVVCEQERDWHRKREVVDLVSALLCVLDPADEVALLGFLRSPLVGMPDAAVESFWLSSVRVQLCKPTVVPSRCEITAAVDAAYAECAAKLSSKLNAALGDWRCTLTQAIGDILELRKCFAESTVAQFFAAFRSKVLSEEIEAARDLGHIRVAAVLELLSDVQRGLEAGQAPALLAADLRQQLAGDSERESKSPSDPEEDAVRLMTVHKAKGLEADHVYFADLGRNANKSDGREKHGVYRWRPNKSNDEAPDMSAQSCALTLMRSKALDVSEAEEQSKQREEYELVRLLYVAATRARKRLVLSAPWSKALTTKAAALSGVFLGLLRKRIEAGAVKAMRIELDAQRVDMRPASEAPGGVLWRRFGRNERGAAAATSAEVGLASIRVALPLGTQHDPEWQRPLTIPISKLGGHGEADGAASEDNGDDEEELTSSVAVSVAPARDGRVRGTQVHRALELWNTDAEPVAEAARILIELAKEGPVDSDAEAIIHKFPKSALCRAFREHGQRILAREFPLLMQSSAHAVLALVGTIDMIYKTEDGTVVVVDYKTNECDAHQLIAEHAPQLSTYRKALREALGAPSVRAELWSLHLDCIIPVPE